MSNSVFNFKYQQCIVVRTDLKLSCGKLCAQVAHASIGAYNKSSLIDKKMWQLEGQKKVVLKVVSEKNLYELKTIAELNGLPTSLIIDAGLTEIAPGTVTALGIGPAKTDIIDKVTGDLPLF
ncbi:MAG TPA: peptidyl-tRNA hydrolase Pth2 [Methanocorpusculum sp.]|nr:peptidyl-tRNA hydrolase Pth2 [Methanocorpusculum sp.]